MSLLKQLKTRLFPKTIENHSVPEYSETGTDRFLEKAKAVYGEDKLKKQQLYERWCVKQHWNLQTEAIPLALGLNPDDSDWRGDAELQGQIDDIFQHAIHCIEHNMSLTVIDSQQEHKDWQVVPSEFYCWASVSRLALPESMSSLMEFIVSSVKNSSLTTDQKDSTPVTPEASSLSYEFDKDYERVLGAALVMLAKYPEQCQDSKGKVKANKINALIEQYQAHVFKDKTLNLSLAAREDLINKWLNLVRENF